MPLAMLQLALLTLPPLRRRRRNSWDICFNLGAGQARHPGPGHCDPRSCLSFLERLLSTSPLSVLWLPSELPHFISIDLQPFLHIMMCIFM